MPKPELTIQDAKHLGKITRSWSMTGAALNDFYSENERAVDDDLYKNLIAGMTANNYDTVRESMGAFLFMCMAGQQHDDGTPVYDLKDIFEPGKLHQEKVQLRQTLEELLEPVPENATKSEKDQAIANRKLVDTFFSNGVKRASERLNEFAEKSVKNNDMAELMKPEPAVLSILLIKAFTNFVENTREYDRTAQKYVAKKDNLVDRLKEMNFDLRAYADTYEGMATFTGQLGQTMANFVLHVDENQELKGLIGIEDYIGFSSIMNKYRKNPNDPVTKAFSSATEAQLIQRADAGQKVVIEDYSPNALGYQFVADMEHLVDGRDVDEFRGSRKNAEVYFKTNRNDPRVQQTRQFIEGYCDITTNATDPEYKYGIALMHFNGRLYPNTSYSADLNMKEHTVSEAGKPDVKTHTASIENVSVRFDNVLDRRTVLREAFLSDLDIAAYRFAPINVDEEDISKINEERSNTIAGLKDTIDELKPLAGASQEWKDMVYAVERAKRISEAYQQKYAAFEEDEENVDAAQKRAALEEVTSAMELARVAAHNYVIHKLDSGKYTEGKDYQRLQVAKKLEKFGEQQCTYLNAKAAEGLNSVHEREGYFNKAAIESDLTNVGKYGVELIKLGQKTTFRSEEFDEMIHSISQLQSLQNQILENKEYNSETDTKYFGGTEANGVYFKGYVDRAIEKIDAYIAHRHKEGITKDLYADRVDAASRLKRYLEIVKAGADRTKEDRFEEYTNKKTEAVNLEAFQKKCDAARKVLRDAYITMRDDVPANKLPADKLPAVKDAICTMYVYQKYRNEMDLIRDGQLKRHEASTVRKVHNGQYNDMIKEFKEKQTANDSFVNRHAGNMNSISKILNEKTFSKTIPIIDTELANRKPLSEDGRYIAIKNLIKDKVEKCKNSIKEMPDGNLDSFTISQFFAQRSMLTALDLIANLPAESEASKGQLYDIFHNSDDSQVNNMAMQIKRSEEVMAIVDRYAGQKQLGDKLEAMYHEYAQLKVFTANHKGEMPDDVDKYLREARANKEDLNKPEDKANNAKAHENEAKKHNNVVENPAVPAMKH